MEPSLPLRVLLVAHNVSGVFDDLEGALAEWADSLASLAASHSADFLALHLQEVGGTRWREEGSLDAVAHVLDALTERMPDFWSSGMLINLDTSESASRDSTFTALGSLYLVRRGAPMRRVSLWRWAEDEGVEGEFIRLSELPAPLQSRPGLPLRYCRHARFPQAIYPEKVDWSRKGRMLTRWRFEGGTFGMGGEDGAGTSRVVDLVNIHNFHDECNLRALQHCSTTPQASSAYLKSSSSTPVSSSDIDRIDSPSGVEEDVSTGVNSVARKEIAGTAQLSPFAACRRRALALVTADVLALSKGVSPAPAVFLFGDFNFRLDLAAVVRLFCGKEGLRAARALDPKKGALQLSTVGAAAGPTTGGLGGLHSSLMNKGKCRTDGVAAEGLDQDVAHGQEGTRLSMRPIPASKLELGKKRFLLGEPRIIARRLTDLRMLDLEPGLQSEPTAHAHWKDVAADSESDRAPAERYFPVGMPLHELPVHFEPTYAFQPQGAATSPDSTSASPSNARPFKRRRGIDSFITRIAAPIFDLGIRAGAPEAAIDATSDHVRDNRPLIKGEAWCEELGGKRCPAWCDRVLMNQAAMDLVRESAEEPIYDAVMQQRIITDHNKVYLRFTCD